MADRGRNGWIQTRMHLGNTIWEDQMEDGARYAVSVTQYEWDGRRWKEAHRFRHSDLPLVARALKWARLRILKELGRQNEKDGVEDEE